MSPDEFFRFGPRVPIGLPALPPTKAPPPRYIVGLDLGQQQDYSALTVVEQVFAPPAGPGCIQRRPLATSGL